jgi:hypothetical protein
MFQRFKDAAFRPRSIIRCEAAPAFAFDDVWPPFRHRALAQLPASLLELMNYQEEYLACRHAYFNSRSVPTTFRRCSDVIMLRHSMAPAWLETRLNFIELRITSSGTDSRMTRRLQNK